MDIGDSNVKWSSIGWNPIFSQRREAIYPKEASIAIYDKVETPSLLTTEEIRDRFLKYKCDGDLYRYLYRNLRIASYLKGLNIDYLRRGSFSDVSAPLVLIDDRNNASGPGSSPSGHSRTTRGALNAHQFYIELCNKRYQDGNNVEENAERRLIYVVDADPYCILALLATASILQAVMLRDFLERNVASNAYLGVEIPFRGTPTFAIEFHLPHYAWRRVEPISKSLPGLSPFSRMSRLRQYLEVKYLNPHHNPIAVEGLKDYLFEARLSILVTGLDNSFWTAYCFADVYFNGQEHADSVRYYYEQNLDPVSGGRVFLPSPEWNPRTYFLIVLSCRIEKVREEWKNVVSLLLGHVKQYTHEVCQKSKTPDFINGEAYNWLVETMMMCTNLLSETIESWEKFNKTDIHYFYKLGTNQFELKSFLSYWAVIDKEFQKLVELTTELRRQMRVFEEMPTNLATRAAWTENYAMRKQSYFLLPLAIVTVCYLPASLASSIFSMQPSLFPEAVTLHHYIHTILGLTFGTLLIFILFPLFVRLWTILRNGQSHLRRWFFGILAACVTKALSTRRPVERTDLERLEMENWNFTSKRA